MNIIFVFSIIILIFIEYSNAYLRGNIGNKNIDEYCLELGNNLSRLEEQDYVNIPSFTNDGFMNFQELVTKYNKNCVKPSPTHILLNANNHQRDLIQIVKKIVSLIYNIGTNNFGTNKNEVTSNWNRITN